MRRHFAARLLALLLASPALAAATPLDGFLAGVRRSVLPNGVTLLVREQPGTGVVAIDTWVEAGYFHEPDEVAGMAHLFEHMFFKGSEKFPGAEQIAQELAAVGGASNAGTIYDSTNYYFVVPKEGFARAVEIQADAIRAPLFDPSELAKEAEVVIEESNRKLDNPVPVSYERMLATSFTEHRIKRWRIGSNEVLRNIRRANLLAFFETLYRPENLIVSIAGDVPAAEAEAIAAKTFGALPRGRLDKRGGPAEPEQTEFRFGRSEGDLRQGYSVMGWHTQGVGGNDELALDLLAKILGDGRSSRLFRHVVGPDGAATAAASHDQFEDVGVFSIQTSFDEARRAEVDRRVLAEVERMKAHGPTPYELRLAVNSLTSGVVLGLEGVLGQAQALAQSEARYGYRALGERLTALAAVTPDEVRDAARRYLTNPRLTLYHYAPKGSAAVDRDAARAAVAAATATPPGAEPPTPLPPAPETLAAAGADRAPRSYPLANGATLVVRERPGAPAVSVGVYFPGGRSAESSATAGTTQLALASTRRGTATRSGEQIDREFEFLGTQLGSEVGNDGFGLTFDVIAANLRPAVDLLADIVLHPEFPADGVAEERALQLAAIRRFFDSSTQRPISLAFRDLFGSHPYGLTAHGTETSVAALDATALADWWRRFAVADGALLLVVGDVDAEAAKALLEGAFAGLPRRSGPAPAVAAPTPPATRTEMVEFRDRKQSAIALAFAAVPPGHPDAVPLRLVESTVSGLAGTLFAELRGKRSLAYTVFCGYLPRREGGAMLAYMATEAAKEPEAKAALVAELRRLTTEGLTEEDFARGKKSLEGSTRIELQTNGALLADYVTNLLQGRELDATERDLERARTVGVGEAREVAARYLGTERFAAGIVRGKS